MLGLLLPSALALLAGWLLGGSVAHLGHAGVRWWPLLVLGFAVELVVYNPPTNALDWAVQVGPAIWLVVRCLMLAAVVRNVCDQRRARWPWLVIACSLGLNTLVIVLNGGAMPTRLEVASVPGRLDNTTPIGPTTHLAWLADVVPEPGWLPRATYISPGDVLLAIGVALWIFQGMQSDTKRCRTLARIRAAAQGFAERSRPPSSRAASALSPAPDGRHPTVRA